MSEYTFYKLSCKDESVFDFYIGKSMNMTTTKYQNKTNSKKSNIYLFKFIRDNGGITNFQYSILFTTICNEDESNIIKQKYINDLSPTLNEYSAYTGIIFNNRTEYINKWYLLNKIRLCCNYNCQCGGKYQTKTINRHMDSQKHKNYLLKKN